jgi:hypothetical protein
MIGVPIGVSVAGSVKASRCGSVNTKNTVLDIVKRHRAA